ncbi:hypothetical protein C8R44DRAFT_949649 [Mycena epipterygia]|nr:hypothetical protein C8R44DRAFT_949649 [Mycena epipterygia]
MHACHGAPARTFGHLTSVGPPPLPRDHPTNVSDSRSLARHHVSVPELRDLFLTIDEDDPESIFDSIRYTPRRSFDSGDPPSLGLCDEEAFDDLPPEDISDDEDQDAPPAVATLVQDSIHPELPETANLYTLLNEISAGVVSLPPEITVLCLQVEVAIFWLSATQGAQVVASLSGLYPFLREIRTGLLGNSHWVREGAGPVWMKKSENEYIQIQQ